MRNIKKYILFSIAQFILISSVYADSLVEKVTVKNSYMLVYINLNKTYNSPLSKYINERLKGGRNNKINQTELYRNIIKTLKKYNLKESDFTEFASTAGLKNPNITSISDIKNQNVSFAFGCSLAKPISFLDLDNITKDIVKNESKVTSTAVIYKKENYIKIVNNSETFYIATLPENKLILGAKDQAGLHLLINNVKNNKHIIFTPELSKIYSKVNKNSNIYFALAAPNSITKKIPASDSFKNDGINSVDSEIFKNITGATLQTDINTDIFFSINTFFVNNKAAKAFNLLLNQFLPTFKIMLFMAAKAPLPMLNTVKNSVVDENIVNFHVKISKQDLKTLYNLAKSKKGVESLSEIVKMK